MPIKSVAKTILESAVHKISFVACIFTHAPPSPWVQV